MFVWHDANARRRCQTQPHAVMDLGNTALLCQNSQVALWGFQSLHGGNSLVRHWGPQDRGLQKPRVFPSGLRETRHMAHMGPRDALTAINRAGTGDQPHLESRLNSGDRAGKPLAKPVRQAWHRCETALIQGPWHHPFCAIVRSSSLGFPVCT